MNNADDPGAFDEYEPPSGLPHMPRVRIGPEDVDSARWSYERLVDHYEERTSKVGIHWEQLTDLEREYWTRLHIVLRDPEA